MTIADNAVNTVDDARPQNIAAKKRLGLGFWLCIGWLVLITAAAILAPILPIKDPAVSYTQFEETESALTGRVTETPIRAPYSPSAEHWVGTDFLTRDVLSRTIWGARVSLFVGFVAVGLSLTVGGLLGMAAAYLHRGVDVAVSFAFLAMLSFPALILAILTTKLAGRSLMTIAVTLGILGIAPVGRLARAQTLVFAERDFVTAARTMGATSRRVLIRELLPNVLIPMSALALLGMGVAIVAEGTLAFLGLSVEQQVTWGAMIFDGSGVADLEKSPLPAFFPAGFLFLTVLSLNFAGDRLRDYFDVRELSI